MPDIPAMALASPTVDIGEVYTQGVWAPANPPTSFEILLGGLDKDNLDAVTYPRPIAPWMTQYGTFAAAVYQGFDRWDHVYALQLADDTDTPRGVKEVNRCIVPGLALNFYLPWDASVIWFGFQAFFRQDATLWDYTGGAGAVRVPEFWDYRVRMDSAYVHEMYGRLPFGRSSVSPCGPIPPTVDPGQQDPRRFRFVTRDASRKAGDPECLHGPHTFRLSLWSGVIGPDPKTAKCIVPTGAMWVLALR